MHVGDPDVVMIPAIAIFGGNIPIATGIALSFKFQKAPRVAVSFFGDGACNEGAFHESLNMAAIWNLPVVYVCENNLYGASTPIRMMAKVENLADRAHSYGIPGVVVDGNDVTAVYQVMSEAARRCRERKGPTFLECKTYRRGGHSRSDACNYRDKEEEKMWSARDPITIFRTKLLENGQASSGDLERINQEVEKEIVEAVRFAQDSPSPEPPEDVLKHGWACREEDR